MTARRHRFGWVAASVVAGTVVIFACHTPTEMSIAITTDVTCRPNGALAPRTAVYVGPSIVGPEPTADTFDCTAGTPANQIGTLTFAPENKGNRESRVTVHIAMNTDGVGTAVCRQKTDPLPKTCIVARRTFRFIEHSSRVLNVHLDRRCAGKVCADDRTCSVDAKGVVDCTPSDVTDPKFVDDTPDGSVAPDVDGGADVAADGAPTDAAEDRAPTDGGVKCLGPNGGTLVPAMTAPSRIAVNGSRVYWVEAASGGLRIVRSTPKNVAGGAVTDETPAATLIHDIAVDDAALWIGMSDKLTRKRFSDGAVSFFVGETRSIGLRENNAFVLQDNAGTVHLRSAPLAGSIAVDLKDKDGDVLGDYVAVAAGGPGTPGRIFILEAGGKSVTNYPLPWSTGSTRAATSMSGIDPATSIAATKNGAAFEAYLTVGSSVIERVAVGDNLASVHANDTENPVSMVADSSGTFHISQVLTEGRILRTLLGPSAGPPPAPSTELEPAVKYFDIQGLATDADCVYFGAMRTGGGGYELLVRPKR